jgi:Toprim domain
VTAAAPLPSAADIARMLAGRIVELVAFLLPEGHREGHEWRCGSVAGEGGTSLGVHLDGAKAGIWCDFATGQRGDALDLVREALGITTIEALAWSRRWLGIADGRAAPPVRPASPGAAEPAPDPERWRKPWGAARPIVGTLAEIYLAGRGLQFCDSAGEVLRFAARRARKSPDDQLEHHPAMLALLRNVRTGAPVGVINIYLRPDGNDRIRDRKGKTTTGRAGGAAVMLDPFDDVTMGLAICEGVETGIALRMDNLAPVWCCGGSGNVKVFPVLGGIEALTIAADAGPPGQQAAEAAAARWRTAGREATILLPRENSDWADPRKVKYE